MAINPSICPSMYLSIYLCVCLFIYIFSILLCCKFISLLHISLTLHCFHFFCHLLLILSPSLSLSILLLLNFGFTLCQSFSFIFYCFILLAFWIPNSLYLPPFNFEFQISNSQLSFKFWSGKRFQSHRENREKEVLGACVKMNARIFSYEFILFLQWNSAYKFHFDRLHFSIAILIFISIMWPLYLPWYDGWTNTLREVYLSMSVSIYLSI